MLCLYQIFDYSKKLSLLNTKKAKFCLQLCNPLYLSLKFFIALVAQSVKRLTLDFGSGHDLMVCEIKPCIGLSTFSAEPAWDSLNKQTNKQTNKHFF